VRGFVKVFRGVLVFRTVATAHVATLQAQPQMHPGVAHFQTLFAALRRFWLYRSYLIEMSAFRHVVSSSHKNLNRIEVIHLFIAPILHPVHW
jgi:hypothetical protein